MIGRRRESNNIPRNDGLYQEPTESDAVGLSFPSYQVDGSVAILLIKAGHVHRNGVSLSCVDIHVHLSGGTTIDAHGFSVDQNGCVAQSKSHYEVRNARRAAVSVTASSSVGLPGRLIVPGATRSGSHQRDQKPRWLEIV
ncbi:hypothetical protein CSOJ01_02338 [Colletotrichum sojae]|uniref:Uncharacterized protein n=1 Tax=Colletotrichum sojae TaxID=2175907 RepID=A0A8H6JS09_9PEZI|nr:hypothetical protein CSOJ01_02338 [Colletotrichum sojae]